MENWVEYHLYGNLDERIVCKINKIQQSMHSKYIWHKQPFHVQLKNDCLYGKTVIGECIEDEWFIVYLLLFISKEFDFIVTIQDNDGQFLLIEAAELLQKEMEPELMENRVFIYKGELHIIPLDVPITKTEQAIKLISKSNRAHIDIENMTFKRARVYPASIDQNLHKYQVFVPHRVAHVIHNCPGLVAPAIDAIYTRDPMNSKALLTMNTFPPTNMVPITVTFTRTLFAQLSGMPFKIPDVFDIPQKDAVSYELGAKLTCGFEMLARNLDSYDENAFTEFKIRLVKLGYFQDEIEGSLLYQKLEQNAKQQFLLQLEKPFWLGDFKRLIDEPLLDPLLFLRAPSDSTDWMYMDPTQVDDLLKSKQVDLDDFDDNGSLDEEEKEELAAFKRVIDGFGQFGQKQSGVKGVVLDSDTEDSDDEYLPVSFDAEKYIQAMTGKPSAEEVELVDIMNTLDADLMDVKKKDYECDEAEADEDYYLMKNLMTSFSEQEGLPGPVSNMIASMGLRLPKNNTFS